MERNRARRIPVLAAYLVIDLSIIVASYLLSLQYIYGIQWVASAPGTVGGGDAVLHVPLDAPEFSFTLFMSATLLLLLMSGGFYETRRGVRYSQEFGGVLRAVLLSALVAVTLNFMVLQQDVSRAFVIVDLCLSFTGLFSWRYIKRKYVEHLVAMGYRRRKALIIGAGNVGEYLRMILKGKDWLGIDVVGFIDDRFGVDEDAGEEILGAVSDYERIVNDYGIEEAYITIPSERKIVPRLVDESNELGVTVKVVPEMYDMIASEVRFRNIGSLPVMNVCMPALSRGQLFTKRVLELALAIPALVILLPLMSLIALGVKLDSSGPVFFTSRILGLDGEPISIFKFRSMIHNADDARHRDYLEKLVTLNEPADSSNGIYKLSDDDRVTRIGRILRKYSLDELPQLWNVIKGELSLVGPRPPMTYEYMHYNNYHKKRLLVKPGLTGLWQVSGKSRLSFEMMIMLDIMYINDWSIWLDMKIILDTIPVVLRGQNM